MELLAALRDAAHRLESAGVPTPGVDAEILLSNLLGVTRGAMLADAQTGKTLDSSRQDEWERGVSRREAREPLQHITGTAAFMDFEVMVGNGVFVPRPETQALVEAAITHAQSIAVGDSGLHIADLCSGSGVVALSLARAVPHAHVVAVEASDQAMPYLTRNVNDLAPDVEVVQAPVEELDRAPGRFDMIPANPPYVPVSEVPNEPEVAHFDPPIALFGGEDGLDTVREIVGYALATLRPGGYLAIEHSNLQGPALRELLQGAGFFGVETEEDFVGRERFTRGFRP